MRKSHSCFWMKTTVFEHQQPRGWQQMLAKKLAAEQQTEQRYRICNDQYQTTSTQTPTQPPMRIFSRNKTGPSWPAVALTLSACLAGTVYGQYLPANVCQPGD